MYRWCVLVVVLSTACAEYVIVADENDAITTPSFCNGIECPEYKLLNKTKDFEVRYYKKTSWVWTTESLARMEDYRSASSTLFMRMFRYISGDNKKHEKVEMTAPVLIKVKPGQGPYCKSNMTMAFFAPADKPTPPPPSTNDIVMGDMPAGKYFVRVFGGFAMSYDTWKDEAVKLSAALDKDGYKYNSQFLSAGYDAPFKLFNRHNEVWFAAE